MSYLKNITKRQMEVIEYVRKGLKDKEIAEQLGIAKNTVKNHLKNIYSRLGVDGRTELSGLDIWFEKSNSNHLPESNALNISGYWLSKFEYVAYRQGINDYVQGAQYDLECLTEDNRSEFFTHKGENIFCSSKSKIQYYHDLSCLIEQSNVVGFWMNKKSTKNMGCFQLYLSNNGNIMYGKHLGNASDNAIKSGKWVWIKVDYDECHRSPELIRKSLRFLNFQELDSIFEENLVTASAIRMTNITKERQRK